MSEYRKTAEAVAALSPEATSTPPSRAGPMRLGTGNISRNNKEPAIYV